MVAGCTARSLVSNEWGTRLSCAMEAQISARSSSAFGRITTDGILLRGGFAGRAEPAALPFHFSHAPRARRADFQTFADVEPKPFELQGVQLRYSL